jgi:polyisoprenyl-teichoic acid--peptidoglycan teichoic acid transferase
MKRKMAEEVGGMENKTEPASISMPHELQGGSVLATSSQPHSSIASGSPKTQDIPLSTKLFRGAAILVATLLSATVGVSAAFLSPLPSAIAPHSSKPRSIGDLWHGAFRYHLSRPVNILIMGIDRVPEAKSGSEEIFSGRSDTMLLLRLDPTNNSVNMLSIPRDTQVEIPSVGVEKINYANVAGGPALSAQIVSRTLNDVPIDRYVRVSTDAFKELVDQLGGVEVYVPERMSYTDQTQKLKIDLQKGLQTLNGDQAEQFARFRNDGYGDIGRVQRQQTLLKALRGRLTNPTVITRIPGIVRVMQKYVDTNLSPEEMLALVNVGLKLDQSNLKMVMLPGRFSSPDEYVASYWIMNPEGRDRVMREYFNLDSTMAESAPRSVTSLRIAVQNASGQPSAGSQMMNYLANQGFYNAYLIEDWADPQSQTQIIVQQGDLEAASDLKNLMGLGSVEAASIGDLESDLTIRIGKDWIKRK